MIDKRVKSLEEAVAGIDDGAVVLIGGFGQVGSPTDLIHALIDQGAKDLTVVNNNAGNAHIGLAALLETGRVRKMICTYPRSTDSEVITNLYRDGKIELEIVPQGTLSERLRSAGAGIGGFYTRTTIGTPMADGKEVKTIDGKDYVLEFPLSADVALVKAEVGDRWGNLTYYKAARNFGPLMCMAARTTIVQVHKFVDLGSIDPEHVVTSGIFVDRVVEITEPIDERVEIERQKKMA
jgi:3-oxoadipate CoA-transferase alpha subunit